MTMLHAGEKYAVLTVHPTHLDGILLTQYLSDDMPDIYEIKVDISSSHDYQVGRALPMWRWQVDPETTYSD